MFYQKQKCLKIFQRVIIYSDEKHNKYIEKFISLKNNLFKKYTMKTLNFAERHSFQNSDHIKKREILIKDNNLVKNSFKNFCILETIRDNDDIKLEDFIEFVTNFQRGDIELTDFPKKYKKYVKEIKLLPAEPDEPEDCCGKDCNPCVIEFYHEKIDKRSYMINNLYKKIYPFNEKEQKNVILEKTATI